MSSRLLLLLAVTAAAQPPAAPPDSLGGPLRAALLASLPDPLHQSSPGWGQTKDVTGIKWRGQGLHVHPETTHSQRNHGTWRKIRVTAIDPDRTFQFELRNLKQADATHLGFTAFAALDVLVEIEKQKWDAGVRLYSGSLRARMHVQLTLDATFECRVDAAPSGGLPDFVFHLHANRADLTYDHLVVEHAAGVGGTAARLLGDLVQDHVHRFHPSLERRLLDRADAAILKAADRREVRVSLSKLFGLGGPAAGK
jgi:hypothetical protein